MKRFFLFCCALPFFTSTQAQNTDTLAMIDKILAVWNDQTPGGVVTIYRNGRQYYNKAAGMADLEHNVHNTPASLFEAGSVSKQFTATAVLMLADEKKISLDDNVRKYIPELPEYGKPITIRHLLTHTSGLRDWGVVAGIAGWERMTREYAQAYALDYIIRQRGLNHLPGEKYLYSNSNYTLLCYIAERVSGQPLSEFTDTRIFKPLGMTHTRWRNDFRQIVPGRTVAYSKNKKGYQQAMPFENTYGHAALLTTTGDLSIWNQSWAAKKFSPGVTAMRTEQGVLNNGKVIAYAAGVFAGRFNGYEEISHSGATAGYRAWMAWYPQAGLSIVCLSNNAATSPVLISKKITVLLLGAPAEPTRDPATLTTAQAAAFAGLYKSTQSHELVKLSARENILFAGDSSRLTALASDTLMAGATKKLALSRDKQTLLLIAEDTVACQRVQVYQPQERELLQYTGTFFSDECNASQQLVLQNGQLTIIRHPSNRSVLTPAFRNGSVRGFLSDDQVLYEFDQRKPGWFKASSTRAEGLIFKLKK